MSKKENVDAFFKDLETRGRKMAADKGRKEYGYIDLSQKGQLFGVASAEGGNGRHWIGSKIRTI